MLTKWAEGAEGIETSAPKPLVPAGAGERFELSAPFVNELKAAETAGRFEAWQEAALLAASKAEALMAALPESPSASARYVQSALIAGDLKGATAAASRILAVSRETLGRDGLVDNPALYVAVTAMASLHEFDDIEELVGHPALSPHVRVQVARALASQDRLAEAEGLLETVELPDAMVLKSFVALQFGKTGDSIRYARAALATRDKNPDALLLLAGAYAALGARRKSIRYARQASVIAPGRKDASMTLLRYLIESREYDEAAREVALIQSRGVVEPPDFLVVQAQIALGRGRARRAVTLLRQAMEASPDERFKAETSSNIASLRYSLGEISREDALNVYREGFSKAPDSLPIATMLLDVLRTVSDGTEARQVLSSLERAGHQESELLPIVTRVAYLNADFSECLRSASAWHDIDPRSLFAANLSAMMKGQLEEDWAAAADVVTRNASRHDAEGLGMYANDLAYVLALAGRPREALKYLALAPENDYIFLATRGLVFVALGQLEEGLSFYRKAADMADRYDLDQQDRALMTIHQAMGLKRLGLDAEDMPVVRAAALPAVPLPEGWEDVPAFRLLERAARERGWPWPVVVD